MENHNLPHNSTNQTDPIDGTRRRFTTSGLVVSGVLLTLASRPSLGGVVCKSPSGFLSGNTSTHGSPQTCIGRTPGYWGNHPENWPSPYLPGSCNKKVGACTDSANWTGGTRFADMGNGFHINNNGSIYLNYSMMQVIWLGGGGDPHQLGAHIVAALLNARMGWTLMLNESQVKNIFNEYNSKGYFEPTAGVKWYPAEIVTYLKSTMPL